MHRNICTVSNPASFCTEDFSQKKLECSKHHGAGPLRMLRDNCCLQIDNTQLIIDVHFHYNLFLPGVCSRWWEVYSGVCKHLAHESHCSLSWSMLSGYKYLVWWCFLIDTPWYCLPNTQDTVFQHDARVHAYSCREGSSCLPPKSLESV